MSATPRSSRSRPSYLTPTSVPPSPRKALFTSPEKYKNKTAQDVRAEGGDPREVFGNLLVTCVLDDNPEDLQLFLDKGADPNHINEYGFTPLFTAVKYNLQRCVVTLLNANANIALSAPHYPSPLEYAIKHLQKESEILQAFFQKLKWLEDHFVVNATSENIDEEDDEVEYIRESKRQKRQYEEQSSISTPRIEDVEEEEEEDVVNGNEQSVEEVEVDIDFDNLNQYTLEELDNYCHDEKIQVKNKHDDKKQNCIEAILRREFKDNGSLILKKLLFRLGIGYGDVKQLRHVKRLAVTIEQESTAEITDEQLDEFVEALRETEKSLGKHWATISDREIRGLNMPWFGPKGKKRTSNVSTMGLENTYHRNDNNSKEN